MAYTAVVGITTVIFGIASLLMISRARNRLSQGSIRRYMDNFAICLTFIVIFSLWQTLRDIFETGFKFSVETSYLTYPEYIFIVFAYIAFIITAYRIQKISEEFGFKEDARRIGQIMKEKNTIPAAVPTKKAAKKKSGKIR